MSSISDADLRKYSENAKGKVVIITGGAMGLGKRAGGEFIRAGAKVVIGDLNLSAAEATVAEWKALGGEATAVRSDVTKWSEQVELFAHAVATYGAVDIVVANAGVGEIGQFEQFNDVKTKEPSKPTLATVDINVVGVLYTARLAMFHFRKNPREHKALVIIGSVASIAGLPMGPMYGHSKHAVLGMMRSLSTSAPPGTNVSIITPWFADTTILEAGIRTVLRGLPWTSIPRVGGAIFLAATDPSPKTNGSAYVLPDDGEVFQLDRTQLDLMSPECYDLLRARVIEQALHPVGPPTVL